MKYVLIGSLFWVFVWVTLVDSSSTSSPPPPPPPPDLTSFCLATQWTKPYGNLNLQFCTKYNGNSCCTLTHDSDISSDYYATSAVGTLCSSKFGLIDWYCFVCRPDQSRFIKNVNGSYVLQVCQSYADQVFGTDLSDPRRTQYDTCGIKPRIPGTAGTCCQGRAQYVAVPSITYQTQLEFLTALIPYHIESQGYKISIVIVDNSTPDCFKS